MIVVGIDPHKHTHTAVTVDPAGRQLAQRTIPARTDGHAQLIGWARTQAPEPTWAIEDCRGVSGQLEADLLAAGERVVRVPAHLMAASRTSVRARGKSDPIDALAIARAALANPELPVAEHDPASLQVKLLADHREDLIAQRTQTVNRLGWQVHQLIPDHRVPSRQLHTPYQLDRLTAQLDALDTSQVVAATRVQICQALIAQLRELTRQITQLADQLSGLVGRLAPRLLDLPGVGVITAARLVGETANPTRFRSPACFGRHTGTAPIPASSGQSDRVRLNRGGNRQLNAALHRIALTQTRNPGRGRDYYQRRQTEGKSKAEALRCLKRRLARVVFTRLVADYHARHPADAGLAAA